jgi:hypothetical protein
MACITILYKTLKIIASYFLKYYFAEDLLFVVTQDPTPFET